MKTHLPKISEIKREFYLIDAENKVLGKIATKVAACLRGKNKANFTRHLDCGDNIIIINADKVALTGKKETDKVYYNHTGYRGGMKSATAIELQKKEPEKLIYNAVYGMLADNRLRAEMLKRLKIYAGTEHPHMGQNPLKLEI